MKKKKGSVYVPDINEGTDLEGKTFNDHVVQPLPKYGLDDTIMRSVQQSNLFVGNEPRIRTVGVFPVSYDPLPYNTEVLSSQVNGVPKKNLGNMQVG